MSVIVISLCAFIALLLRFRRKRRVTSEYVTRALEDFLSNQGGPYDWDDFLSLSLSDPQLDEIRRRCAAIDWMTCGGKEELKLILRDLKTLLNARASEAKQIEMPMEQGVGAAERDSKH